MTFDDILDQILALLRRQRRVSYWALKRRFDLHDDDIPGLKDEIITARQLACIALSAAMALYRAMDMTFWLPQTEVALAQVEGR